ncbi:MAG TPA: branched chain amino acid aminotransferase, partial [Planctomycetes bacterium]|nr:branched chain amino acid aminotransferase [Planctomycetota bacterium]
MERRDLPWSELGFDYVQPRFRFQAIWEDGAWSEGELLEDATIPIEEGACSIHYGQQCFEGLKAYPGPDGTPLLFRVDQNAARLQRTAERLLMQP